MKAFLRHILRSADSEKGQVAVIVITIAIVTAMVFIAFSMFDVFFNINMEEYDRVADGADMLLGNNFETGTTFSKARLDRILESQPEGEIESIMYFTKFPTIMKTDTESKSILVEATDLEDYLTSNELRYVELFDENTVNPDVMFTESGGYSSIIVGENFAAKAGIKAGDLVEIYLPTYERYLSFVVRAVALNEGIFGASADLNVLVDFEAVGNQGQVSAVYINFTNDTLFEKYEQLFETYFPAVECGEGNSYSQVVDIVRNNTLLFTIALIFLTALMMLILFTSYLIVSRNRMSEMIIFKSAGATPNQIALIMLLEVVFYALVGSALGLLLGRVAMGIVTEALLPLAPHAVTYPAWKFIAAFFISIVVSILATLVPVIQVSKKTVRELSSSGFKMAKRPNKILLIVTSIVVVAICVAYAFLEGIALLILSLALIVAIAVWIYVAIYYVTLIAGKLIKKICPNGAPQLAGITVLRSSSMKTVTTLIAVVITFSFLITQVVGIVSDATIPSRTRYTTDYVVMPQGELLPSDFDPIKGTILNTPGVDGAGWYNSTNYYFIKDTNDMTAYGVSDFWMLDRMTENVDEGTEERWNNAENPIVLNQNVVMMLGVKIGDKINLYPTSDDYKTETHEFTLVGIDRSVTQWDMVGFCKYTHVYRMSKTASFFASSSEPSDEVFTALRDRMENVNGIQSFTLTYEEWAFAGQESFAGVGSIMTLLQILVWFVSFMGIVNISIVTVYDRRAEYKLYKFSGMSGNDYVKFSIAEGIVLALSGGVLGLLAGYAVNMLVPSLGSIILRYTGFNIFPLELLLTFLIGAGAFLLLWTIIALVNRKNVTNVRAINERFS